MSPRLRAVLLLAGVGSAAALVFATVARSPDAVRDAVDSFGVAAPLLFVPVAALLSVALFPGALLAGAAGLLFGPVLGTALAVVSSTVAAAVAYELSRHGARPLVEELEGERVRRWRAWVQRRGFAAVLYARLAPGIPFSVVSYAAGTTRVRLAVFLAATALGVVPRAFAYATLGGTLDDLGSPAAVAAFAVLVGVGGLGLFLFRRAGPGRGSSSPAGRSAAPR